MDFPDEKQIMSLIASGEAEAFGELIERYQKPVFRLAYSMLGNRGDAEDAAQDTFVRAYKSILTYTESGRLWGWLRRITVNVCLKKTRSIELIPLDEAYLTPAEPDDTVERSVIAAFEAAELRRAVLELPAPYRSVIVLKYLEDMTYAEIAETLGEPVTNVQVRIHRAKKMLRERMKVNA